MIATLAALALSLAVHAVSGSAYPLHAAQMDIVRAPSRHVFAVCGRGFGKTHAAGAIIGTELTSEYARELGGQYEAYYVAPSYKLAKRIVWKRIKALFPRHLLAKAPHETDLRIETAWGPSLTLIGADNIDGNRGPDSHLLILDEFAFCPDGTWEAFEPSLRTQRDRAIIITTPNGPNHAWSLWQSTQGDPEWSTFQLPTWSNPFHDARGLERRRARLARNVFDQEYGAQFEAQKGAVYSDFSQPLHIKPVELDRSSEIVVGQDFNAGHYCAVITQRRGPAMVVLDELVTTTQMFDHIARLKGYFERAGINWRTQVLIATDASGDYNATSRVTADSRLLREAGFRTQHDAKNPPVIDRVHCVQGLLLTGTGEVRFAMSPRCTELRVAMLSQKWSPWGNKPEKKGGLDDVTDALGYAAWHHFPMRPDGYARSA